MLCGLKVRHAAWLDLERTGMPAIRTLRPARTSLQEHAPLSREEAARRRAMLLHPSHFKPSASPGTDAGGMAEELGSRFECLHEDLVCRGLPDNEARTEVARIAGREVWDGFALHSCATTAVCWTGCTSMAAPPSRTQLSSSRQWRLSSAGKRQDRTLGPAAKVADTK